MQLPKEKSLAMYKTMTKVRMFEEQMIEFFQAGKVPGALHLSLGQEAVATGVCAALEETDYIISSHRGHGHLIAKGADVSLMMAEILGKKTGYCKGKGGSLHIAIPKSGIMGTNGIVGAGAPLAVGAAFGSQYQGTGRVTVSFFGEGAANQGTVSEAMNLAACWKLPVVFVIENNLYALSCSIDRAMCLTDVAERASAFGMPGVVVDGNDVIAIYETAYEAVKRARDGEGPSLIECKTYRWRGHFEGDPCVYRPKEELEEWKAKDPIPRFEEKLLEMRVASQMEIDEIKHSVEKEIAEAIRFADKSPFLDRSELLKDVYTH